MARSPEVEARRLQSWYASRRHRGLVLNPCPGFPVTYPYGVPSDAYAAGHHTGEDHSTRQEVGKKVVATAPATVTQVSTRGGTWGSAYGTIVVLHTRIDGVSYHVGYCHLMAVAPQIVPGRRVVPGEVLGRSGNTGNSTGPHLHFEVRVAPFRYGSDVPPIRVKQKKG